LSMAKTLIVKQGEHLSGIAEDNGFANFHVILDHPNNAALRALRDDHVLFPGDKLFIPDRQEKIEQGVTAKLHTFEVKIPSLFLRLCVHDLDNQPVAKAQGTLGLESKDPAQVQTDGKGIIEREIVRPVSRVRDGELRLEKSNTKLKFDLKIGHLNPKNKLSGQQARLNNLGYFAGFSLDDLDQLLWAAEEFECDQINKSKAAVTKRPKLKAVPPGDAKARAQEEQDEQSDPATDTGILDAKLRDGLKTVHGC
jgi:hypothetical protein